MFRLLFSIILLVAGSACAQEPLFDSSLSQQLPAAYKGRFRPQEAYSRLWLSELYHRQAIRAKDSNQFPFDVTSALDLIWLLDILGHKMWDDAPLFFVEESSLAEALELPADRWYSFHQLMKALQKNERTNLKVIHPLIAHHAAKESRLERPVELKALSPGLWVSSNEEGLIILEAPDHFPWHHLKAGTTVESAESPLFADHISSLLISLQTYQQQAGAEDLFQEGYHTLTQNGLSPKEIAQILESQFPFKQRLSKASELLFLLPSRAKAGEWLPIKALKVRVYDPVKQSLKPVSNFTAFTDVQFQKIQMQYEILENAVLKFSQQPDSVSAQLVREEADKLFHSLQEGYAKLAGTPFQTAQGSALFYPSWGQLQAEIWYYHYPWLEMAIVVYFIAFLLLFFSWTLNTPSWQTWGVGAAILAFVLNSFVLILRCYILWRPPVSNMYETALYVPWVAMAIGLLLWIFGRQRAALAAAALVSFAILTLLQFSGLSQQLDNVQAVLNSQYWLIVHVLMVVGSYGAYCVAGILGHAYLIYSLSHQPNRHIEEKLGKGILQAMYVGTALLIPGTILGGVWAAESWGRFWDWDPKESWAFISSCVYLAIIHAHRFRYIHYFGLAIGSLIGLQAIIFTWYGVNYLLGTGMHSYGFGSGGEGWYFGFILFELLFILTVLLKHNHLLEKILLYKRSPLEKK